MRGSGAASAIVLQFSTGESVALASSGLIGRRPVAEPGEHVDQLVTVMDPTRSVSRVHLEFGHDEGTLWISDRYSGNGTLIWDGVGAGDRAMASDATRDAAGDTRNGEDETRDGDPDRAPDEAGARRCIPGRRYQVERGARVEIGDQFFVVG